MIEALSTALRWLALASTLATAASIWRRRGSGAAVPPAQWAGGDPRTLLAYASIGVMAVESAIRWAQTGHPPIFGTYENTLASALALSLVVAAVLRTGRAYAAAITPEGSPASVSEHAPLWLRLVALWPPVTLAYGMFFRSTPLPLTISERSLWIDLHVLLAWIAYALLLAGSMRAIAGLIEGPDAETDRHLLRAAGLGFAALTMMMLVGSWYSYRLFAEWYKWEIVETVTAATWLGYASVLHARLALGWHGRRFYWAMVVVLPLLVLSFWVWSLYSGTYHFFDINIIRAR